MTVFGAVAVLGAIVGIAIPALAASPWEEYLERPTPDNAARVQSLTYSSAVADPGDIERDLMLLEVQVVSRDTKAVQLAFRLLSGATGHIAERLDIMLGRLIRIDAALFLRELKRAGPGTVSLGHLVGNFGPEYVDRLDAHAYEMSLRQDALRRISDPKLKAVRDQCLESLKK